MFTTTSKSNASFTVLNFTANVQFQVAIGLEDSRLLVQLKNFEKVGLIFKTVANFEITNHKLVEEQAVKVLKNLIGTKTFGTGYPMVTAKDPAV